MPDSTDEYAITDQLMVKALLCLEIKPKNVTTDDRHQLRWIFRLRDTFTNNGVIRNVSEAVEDIRMGRMDKYVITLTQVWAADNFWQMNLRHRDVLSNHS